MIASFEIPLPPSLNNIFFTAKHGRRVKTTAYKNWRDAAALLIKTKCRMVFQGDVIARVVVERPNKASDLDNRLKPIFDAIQCAGVLKNDNQIVELHAAWGEVEGAAIVLADAA